MKGIVREDEQVYVVYINGKKVTKCTSRPEAEKQVSIMKRKYPNAKFEIKSEVSESTQPPANDNLYDPIIPIIGGAGTYTLSNLKNKAKREVKDLLDEVTNERWEVAAHAVKQVANTLNTLSTAIKLMNEKNPDNLTEDDDSVDAVAQAITHRILRTKPNLLRTYSVEQVTDAITDVANRVGAVDEIGSSDVSIWVRWVEETLENSQKSMKESVKPWMKRPNEAGFEIPAYQRKQEYEKNLKDADRLTTPKVRTVKDADT